MFPFVVSPFKGIPHLDIVVVLCDEEDARNIARKHVRKSDMYGIGKPKIGLNTARLNRGIAFLGNGVLSTRDIDNWREQRQHLTEAFFPVVRCF